MYILQHFVSLDSPCLSNTGSFPNARHFGLKRCAAESAEELALTRTTSTANGRTKGSSYLFMSSRKAMVPPPHPHTHHLSVAIPKWNTMSPTTTYGHRN
ncbi:hypothetical protein CEXT_217681 [Caerostris extrusa]|uniref:Uncharacterized protein n=1 Tax=Caerostris extrusa TaxID=172846 RepID=A0AAV4S9A3_CAEEX|nr:hypothetical protein CEXT_217681 [Caerostris extrusa]